MFTLHLLSREPAVKSRKLSELARFRTPFEVLTVWIGLEWMVQPDRSKGGKGGPADPEALR